MKPTRTLSAATLFLGVVLVTVAGGCNAASSKTQNNARADISGTWERTPDDWFGENPDDPVHPGGPMDLKEPYARQYAALKKKQAAANEAGTPLATTSSKCLPEGMPTLMAALFPIQIIHDDKQVIVLGEYLQQVRRILLNQALPPKEKLDPKYQGHSRGHWEGDTLVVETQRVRTDVTFYDVPHSEEMKITERIRATRAESLGRPGGDRGPAGAQHPVSVHVRLQALQLRHPRVCLREQPDRHRQRRQGVPEP